MDDTPQHNPKLPRLRRAGRTAAAATKEGAQATAKHATNGARKALQWPTDRIRKQLQEELGHDAMILETTWPDEQAPRPVLLRRTAIGPAIRITGLALTIVAALTLPTAALFAIPILHGLAVAFRRAGGHRLTTAVKEDDPRGKRAQRKVINAAARRIAGEAFLAFALSDVLLGTAAYFLTNGYALRAFIVAYAAGAALYLYLEWVDDYVLVAANHMLMRNRGILWMHQRISVPLETAVPADMSTFLPNIGFSSIDVKMIDNDQIFHSIGPITRPSQWHQLLKRLRGDLKDTPPESP